MHRQALTVHHILPSDCHVLRYPIERDECKRLFVQSSALKLTKGTRYAITWAFRKTLSRSTVRYACLYSTRRARLDGVVESNQKTDASNSKPQCSMGEGLFVPDHHQTNNNHAWQIVGCHSPATSYIITEEIFLTAASPWYSPRTDIRQMFIQLRECPGKCLTNLVILYGGHLERDRKENSTTVHPIC